MKCSFCQRPISEAQAGLSVLRADGAKPACADCITARLSAWQHTDRLAVIGHAYNDRLVRERLRLRAQERERA